MTGVSSWRSPLTRPQVRAGVAYLHDDVTRKLPTVELALALFCEDEEERWAGLKAFHSGAAWRRLAILDVVDPPDGPHALLARRLKLDDRIVQFLPGSSALPEPASRFAKIAWGTGSSRRQSMRSCWCSCGASSMRISGGRRPLIDHPARRPVRQRAGEVANAAAAHMGLPTLWVDLRSMVALESGDRFDVALQRLLREALLQPAAIGVRDFHAITPTEGSNAGHLAAILDALRTYSRLTFLLTEEPQPLTSFFREETFLSLTCPEPSLEARSALWAELLRADDRCESPDLAEVASKFRFTPGQIRDAVASEDPGRARRLAWTGHRCEPVARRLRMTASPRFGDLARKIAPVFGWKSIVLPEDQVAQLREIVAQVRHRRTSWARGASTARCPLGRGVTALFAGARHRQDHGGRDHRRRAGARPVQDRPVGGRQQVHRRDREEPRPDLRATAQNGNAILFFDEADALFGKRIGGQGRPRPLRQHRDRLPAAAAWRSTTASSILATNLRQNIDEAFMRRLQFIVEFPFPDAGATGLGSGEGSFRPKRRWRRTSTSSSWPANFELTGGNIRNIALPPPSSPPATAA